MICIKRLSIRTADTNNKKRKFEIYDVICINSNRLEDLNFFKQIIHIVELSR